MPPSPCIVHRQTSVACLPVENHGGELPVALDGAGLLVVSDLVCDDLDLLEDEAQLPGHAARVGPAVHGLLAGRHRARPHPEYHIG